MFSISETYTAKVGSTNYASYGAFG